jgi:ABC-type multidrug transport system ATPase subunit
VSVAEQVAQYAIDLEGVSKRYKEVLAVDSLDLHVRRGEIYGFLGRNGAGKTTTIRMILGLIRPTRGFVRILGNNLMSGREKALASVGYLVESATSYPTLTVRENLEIQRRLTGVGASAVGKAIQSMHLEEYADRRAGRLSLGNKQRLALARALLHSPEILVLDEPANGLDPAGIAEIRELLRAFSRERGVTVFLSSHILGEIAQLADRIGIIHKGRLVEEVSEYSSSSNSWIEATVSDAAKAAAVLTESLGLSAVTVTGPSGLRIAGDHCRPRDVARAIVGAGLDLEKLCPVSEDLEARFMRLTGEEQ